MRIVYENLIHKLKISFVHLVKGAYQITRMGGGVNDKELIEIQTITF